MYKTVRQGENSLQYTILPQTEEVLTNSGVKGKGRDYSPSSHARRINKKLMIYYMVVVFFGLLLTLGTILFALVLCGIVPFDLPHAASLKHELATTKTTTPYTTTESDKSGTRKKELAHDMKLLQNTNIQKSNFTLNKTDTDNTTAKIETVITASVPTTTVSNLLTSTEPEFILPALKRLQLTTTVETKTVSDLNKVTTIKPIAKLSSPFIRQRENNGDLMLDHDQINYTDYEDDDDDDYDVMKTSTTESNTVKKTVTTTPEYILRSTRIIETSSTTAHPDVIENPKILLKNKTSPDSMKSKLNMEIKERILSADDEEYKEPLADEEDVPEHVPTDDVKMSHAKSSWIQNRWPFVDPSSYFQWTGYSARDNLLLPAILSAALSALLVLAILCYALRRRQRCKRRIQEIGNLTSDLQAEDNATLLTAENPSEED